MKIRGTTITTPIARSAVADDKSVSKNPWSSKNTVDKLCPTFTESGSVVTCEPVEGYPLEVEWHRKNLWKVDTNVIDGGYLSPSGNTATIAYASGAYTVFVPCEPNTTYTVSKFAGKRFGFGYSVDRPDVGVTVYGYTSVGDATSLTTTTGADAKYLVAYVYFDGTDASIMSWNDAKHTVQIELGNTATAYQPYAETATITHCGKNILNMDAELGDYFTKDGDIYTGTFNKEGYRFAPWVDAFIPANNTLTFSADVVEKTTVSAHPLQILLLHEDGTQTIMSLTMKANLTKNVVRYRVFLSNEDINLYIRFRNPQLEIGKTATAYEPYRGSTTYAPNEPIPAFDGTNVIYPNVGTVTVTGKANPSAIIEKLTNAILSLGGNV